MRLKDKKCILALVLVLLFLSGCTSSAQPTSAQKDDVSRTVFAMDTVMELSPCGEHGKEACDLAEARIQSLESLLSVTLPDSEIYAVNHASGKAVSLSDDTFALLRAALDWCGRTDGALDISVYPVLRTWGFTTGSYDVPSAETLAALLENVDYHRVALDADAQTVTIPENMEIDLGSVAKGYTGDAVMQIFRDCGVKSGMVSLGGNVQVLGTKPDGTNWHIAVQDPHAEGYVGIVEVADQAVITSGGYERYFERDGVTYWHILDPATGQPARSGVVSATVIGGNGTMCDALSTSLFVMGAERAAAFWRANAALGFDFVLVLDDGSLVISEGIEDRFTPCGDWEDAEIEVIRR